MEQCEKSHGRPTVRPRDQSYKFVKRVWRRGGGTRREVVEVSTVMTDTNKQLLQICQTVGTLQPLDGAQETAKTTRKNLGWECYCRWQEKCYRLHGNDIPTKTRQDGAGTTLSLELMQQLHHLVTIGRGGAVCPALSRSSYRPEGKAAPLVSVRVSRPRPPVRFWFWP